MRFELFVALRYLFFRKGGQKLISITSIVAVIGVAIGVGALIVVMGVMNGFTVDLRDKIIGVTSHAIVTSTLGYSKEDPQTLAAINNTAGVIAATPFIYSELMLSTSSGVKGIALRGIDPVSGPQVIGALNPKKIIAGDLADLGSTDGLPGIVIGKDLANKLHLDIGSRVNLLAPSGQQSTSGFNPKIRYFRVVAIFSINLYEYDSTIAFTSIPAMRDIAGIPEGLVSGFEFAVKDVYTVEKTTEEVLSALGPNFHIQTWIDMNGNLFAALKLEKIAMAIILTLVIVVGSFSIITALVMLVMEKTKDIAILMSMGATSQSIRNIFMFQGIIIGLIGTTLGYIGGLLASDLLKRYEIIELPKGVYSTDTLPILIEMPDLIATGIGSFLLCFLATLYPSRQAASLEPVAALRSE